MVRPIGCYSSRAVGKLAIQALWKCSLWSLHGGEAIHVIIMNVWRRQPLEPWVRIVLPGAAECQTCSVTSSWNTVQV